MRDLGLRRADWRFLLPAPQNGQFEHLVLLGADSERAAMLLNAGVARRVSTQVTSPGSADAVILLAAAKISFPDAARMLQSGGAFYAEVDRRLTGRWCLTPSRSKRRLHEVGLSVTCVYLVLPGFEAARRYVPIDHPGLLHWYFETLHSPRTLPALIASVGLQVVAGRKYRRLGPVFPWYGITAVSGLATGAVPSVLAQPELPDSLRPPSVRALMLTNGQDDGSRVVFLPFAGEGDDPIGAVKVSRAAAFNGNTEREQHALSNLRQQLDDSFRRSIPEPLGIVQYAGLSVAVESCAPGASLTVSTGQLGRRFSTAVQDLRLSLTWLSEFQRQTRSGPIAWTLEDSQHVDARLEQYAEEVAVADRTRQLLRRSSAELHSLIGATLPKACLHNDFGPWNVYRQGDHISVIDWEFGEQGASDRTGPVLCDLIYFVTHWTLRARRLWSREATLRGFRELFLGPEKGTRASLAARGALKEYLARHGIDGHFLPPLLVYTWIERSLDQLARPRDGGPADIPPLVTQYGQFVDLLAQRGEQLFTDPLP